MRQQDVAAIKKNYEEHLKRRGQEAILNIPRLAPGTDLATLNITPLYKVEFSGPPAEESYAGYVPGASADILLLPEQGLVASHVTEMRDPRPALQDVMRRPDVQVVLDAAKKMDAETPGLVSEREEDLVDPVHLMYSVRWNDWTSGKLHWIPETDALPGEPQLGRWVRQTWPSGTFVIERLPIR